MSNIYEPIDSSNLSEVLPQGDDVLFSTMTKVVCSSGGSSIKWKSHVIASTSGIAYQSKLDPHKDKGNWVRYKVRKKKMGLVAEFVPWEEFGTDVDNPPKAQGGFRKNSIVIILNKDAGMLKRVYVNFKDENKAGLGDFCLNYWMEKFM